MFLSNPEVPSNETVTNTDEDQEKVIITPDTGSDELLIPALLITVGAAAALSIIICRKRKSAVQ